ncbi:MAG: hypothetical protein IBJ03_08115 [Gemmatimonadaceae bacterium]|nr:hypothetical protein [Gemmatimonadaceae bacterium]
MTHCADLPRPTPVVLIGDDHWESPAAHTRTMATACVAQRDVLVVEPPRFLDDAAYPMLHVVQPSDGIEASSDVAGSSTTTAHALIRVVPLLPRRLLTESAATAREVWGLVRTELMRWSWHHASIAERFESPQYWCCLPEALASVRDVFGEGAMLPAWNYESVGSVGGAS